MILDYVHHTNVGGQQDTLDKIRSFAITQGWAQEAWTTGYRWDTTSPYGFTLADPDGAYLELSSTGYGTQSLIARLECYNSYNNSVPGVGVNMVDTVGYSLIQTLPYCQDRLTFGYDDIVSKVAGMNIGIADYDDLWIYGDDKWIGASLSMDGVYCQHLHFGSFEIYEPNPSQGMCRGYTTYVDDWTWYGYADATSGYVGHPYWVVEGYEYAGTGKRLPSFDIYWDDQSKYNSYNDMKIAWNIWPWDNYFDSGIPYYLRTSYSPFLNIGTCLKTNAFSGKRPMFKQNYWCKRTSDSLWVPVCRSPIYFLNTAGLTIGEVITYGLEEFICFPFGPYQSPLGMAVQIA
jgi:hypothetical protein